MPKIKSRKMAGKRAKNVPLAQQIIEGRVAKPTGRVKSKKGKRDEDVVQILDDRTSKKLLIGVKKLKEEFKESEESDNLDEVWESKKGDKMEDDEEVDEFAGFNQRDEDGERMFSDLKMTEDDAAGLEMFMSRNPPKKRTLGEYIAEKVKQKELEMAGGPGGESRMDVCSVSFEKLDPRVTKLYDGVRQVMSKYRSGKIPKAFKIIPSLNNWEQVLQLTDPENWTAAAMYGATRLFASNLNEKMAQRFYNLILLPRIRDDIGEYKRLNFHLYQALRKALFRPGSFFKGIVLPLIEEGDCTLREAVIIGSVLAKNSVPMLHSAAALLKMAEMEYSGATTIFMHVLLSKKYALPYRVLDGLVMHWTKFETDRRTMPVLWHQTLLIFVQNYGPDLSSDQKEALNSLMKVHNHWQITDVIRKELWKEKPQDEVMSTEG